MQETERLSMNQITNAKIDSVRLGIEDHGIMKINQILKKEIDNAKFFK